MANRDTLWPQVMGYFLWVVSAVIGLGALFAAIDLIEQVAIALISPGCDPLRPVECAGSIRMVMIGSYGVLGITWLVWYILLAERYPKSNSAEQLARRFAVTTAIQVAIIALWVIIDRWLVV